MQFNGLDNKDLLILQMLMQSNHSIHELRVAIQARSTGTVANRLKKLEEMGFIRNQGPRVPRSRNITTEGMSLLVQAGLVSHEAVQLRLRSQNLTEHPTS